MAQSTTASHDEKHRRISQEDFDEYYDYIDSMNDNINATIVGGSNANYYPWFVHFASKVCAGTLISPDRVLTSATCISLTGLPSFVRVGATNQMNGVLARVTCAKMHPDYQLVGSTTILNDVAILQLASAVSGITPVRLNSDPNYPSSSGTTLMALGMGLSSTIKRLDLNYVSTFQCQAGYSSDNIIQNGIHLCGQATGKGMCTGDSGGPLLDDDSRVAVQVGIASFTYGDCGEKNIPDVFAPIAPYYEWIQSQIQDNTCGGISTTDTFSPYPTISSSPSVSKQPSFSPSLSAQPSLLPSQSPPSNAPSLSPTNSPMAAIAVVSWVINQVSAHVDKKRQWIQNVFHV